MYNYDRLFFTLDSLALPTYALKTRFDLRVMVSEIKRAKWSQKGQTWKIITFFILSPICMHFCVEFLRTLI